MARSTRSLVEALLELPPKPDSKLQELRAETLRAEVRAAYLPRAGDKSCTCTDWSRIERERELMLIDFALEQEIDLTLPNWRYSALSIAAFEHPKLRTGKRARGRPRKSQLGGLLALGAGLDAGFDSDDADAFKLVERIKEFIKKKHGDALSDRRAAGIFVLLQSQENEADPITRDSPLYESRRRQVCNKVSRHRSYLRKAGKLS